MSDANRPKVGDKDPEFAENERKRKAKEARIKAQKERGALLSEHSKTAAKEKPKGVLATIGELRKKPDGSGGPGGKTRLRAIDRVVDEALGEAKRESYF